MSHLPQASGLPKAMPQEPFFITIPTTLSVQQAAITANWTRKVTNSKAQNTSTPLAAVSTLVGAFIIFNDAASQNSIYLSIDSAATPVPYIIKGGSYAMTAPANKVFDLNKINIITDTDPGTYNWSLSYI